MNMLINNMCNNKLNSSEAMEGSIFTVLGHLTNKKYELYGRMISMQLQYLLPLFFSNPTSKRCNADAFKTNDHNTYFLTNISFSLVVLAETVRV